MQLWKVGLGVRGMAILGFHVIFALVKLGKHFVAALEQAKSSLTLVSTGMARACCGCDTDVWGRGVRVEDRSNSASS